MACVLLVDGVVELGSTELILQSLDLMNNMESNSWPIIGHGVRTVHGADSPGSDLMNNLESNSWPIIGPGDNDPLLVS